MKWERADIKWEKKERVKAKRKRKRKRRRRKTTIKKQMIAAVAPDECYRRDATLRTANRGIVVIVAVEVQRND